MKLKILFIAICTVQGVLLPIDVVARPRLAINIVVGGMSADDLQRYGHNFGAGGFRRAMQEGATFTECYADYAPTSTEAGLATLATGALPSMHGVISATRFDRTANVPVSLCHKSRTSREVIISEVATNYDTSHLSAQTLAEAARSSVANARTITIAHNPLSAILLAGRGGECYWIDEKGRWSTADCYAAELPSWVRSYNDDDMNRVFASEVWYGRYTANRYRNKRATDITIYEQGKSGKKSSRTMVKSRESEWVKRMLRMPAGNHALFEFAKRAVGSMMPLHINDECKVLNICLDVPRNIVERYGPGSAEYEDMLYSLDVLLGEFITFVYAQVASQEDVLFTLTSDHGTSPTQLGESSDRLRFNKRQFEVIMNAFLGARYGQDNWVLGYTNGSLYLNHDIIYKHKVSIAQVQNEVATFALQFRGVTNALTATALKGGTLLHGTSRLVQNGYHPRYSGDVMVVLEPERIELDATRCSASGSPYNYDRHIPLLIWGGGVAHQQNDDRVCSEQIAPTVAAILGIARPQCCDAKKIAGIKR